MHRVVVVWSIISGSGSSAGELGYGVIAAAMVHWPQMTTPCTPQMGMVMIVMWRHQQHGLQVHRFPRPSYTGNV